MIVNPDKFQAIVLNKKTHKQTRSDLTNTNFQVDNQVIKLVSSVKLLGTQIVDKLDFNLRISKICKSAENQLNALIILKQFLSVHAKEVLINSYIISNFNYCPLKQFLSFHAKEVLINSFIISNFSYFPLVWMFSSA